MHQGAKGWHDYSFIAHGYVESYVESYAEGPVGSYVERPAGSHVRKDSSQILKTSFNE